MNRAKKNLNLIIIIILAIIGVWLYQGIDNFYQGSRTAVEKDDLFFNKPNSEGESPRPTIVSSDEKINIEVFEKVHQAVVNVVATTLEVNFWMEIIPRSGQGSGFIIDPQGYILTNNHVVANARRITVTLSGEEKVRAKLIGRDPSSDLAVIKIPARYVKEVAILGDSDRIKIGQKAIAIGNPFGLSQTLTTGIVSALKRQIRTEQGTTIDNLIQTDAAINPGNSGGPLLNSQGEVIGINTAIFTLSGGSQGIGFALPINHAKEVATQLITKGRVIRPWLGITGISLTPQLAEALDIPVSYGVMVVEVVSGGPAHKAGIRGGNQLVVIGNLRFPVGGDIIVAIDKKSINNMGSLLGKLKNYEVGQTIQVEIIRGKAIRVIPVTLEERPE